MSMVSIFTKLAPLLILISLIPTFACGSAIGPSEIIDRMTYYIPSVGGSNGSCSGGKAFGNACNNTLEKFLKKESDLSGTKEKAK